MVEREKGKVLLIVACGTSALLPLSAQPQELFFLVVTGTAKEIQQAIQNGAGVSERNSDACRKRAGPDLMSR